MSDLNNPFMIKFVSATIIASAIDRFYFQFEQNTQHNLIFGISTGAGIALGSLIGNQIPSVIQDTTFYNGKTIAQRSFELIFGSVVSYGSFAYSGYNYTPSDMYARIGAVVATDFASEYITDYMSGNPLGYLA